MYVVRLRLEFKADGISNTFLKKTGRIELTSERTDREEEIKELKKSIAEEKDMRATENTNYVAALDEMTKAIAALENAVQVPIHICRIRFE